MEFPGVQIEVDVGAARQAVSDADGEVVDVQLTDQLIPNRQV